MFSLNIHGRLVRYDSPAVMGIINATPDSFHAASRVRTEEAAAAVAAAYGRRLLPAKDQVDDLIVGEIDRSAL